MDNQILLTIQGTIQTCYTNRTDDLYCKYGFSYRGNWAPLQGHRAGITQTSHKNGEEPAIFNSPFCASFKSSDPFGWPQIIITIYGNNVFGNDMVVGYGCTHIPTQTGKYTIQIPLFVPESPSFAAKIVQFFSGLTPEFIDPFQAASGERRGDLRTNSNGYVSLEVNVLINDMEHLQFQN